MISSLILVVLPGNEFWQDSHAIAARIRLQRLDEEADILPRIQPDDEMLTVGPVVWTTCHSIVSNAILRVAHYTACLVLSRMCDCIYSLHVPNPNQFRL